MKLTKSKLKEIIREEIQQLNEKISIRDASQAMEKRFDELMPIKVAGFKFDIEWTSGSWRWDKGGISIYATYGWENFKGIPIDVRGGDDETVFSTSVKMKPSGDSNMDVKNYLKTMKKVLPALFRKYKSYARRS